MKENNKPYNIDGGIDKYFVKTIFHDRLLEEISETETPAESQSQNSVPSVGQNVVESEEVVILKRENSVLSIKCTELEKANQRLMKDNRAMK